MAGQIGINNFTKNLMRILIDIGHPAHVHLFKNFAWQMAKRGHEFFFTCREKEFEIHLLQKYGFSYKSFGSKIHFRFGKMVGGLWYDYLALVQGLKFKPQLLLSHGSMYAAHAAFFLRKPHISFEDTFNFEQIPFYKPFTKIILTGDYDHPDLGEKNIKYSGYHELAYLHPSVFAPDHDFKLKLNLANKQKLVIVRFISWRATHDSGHAGIADKNKLLAVQRFSEHARVIVSSEDKLAGELLPYQNPYPPEEMHQLIACADLIFGESGTMSSEAAVLGVPAIYLDNKSRLYTQEQERKYGLVFNFSESLSDQKRAIDKGIELLTTAGLKVEWQKRRQKMLHEKIDVTAFLVWFVENYPESSRLMRDQPEIIQKNFIEQS